MIPDERDRLKIRQRTLRLAEELTTQDREQQYGDPHELNALIAEYWGQLFEVEISAYHVPMAMILLKLARIQHDQSVGDNWVDIAGYAALGAEIAGVYIPNTQPSEEEDQSEQSY